MATTYTFFRYGKKQAQEFNSVKKAIQRAMNDHEFGGAYPFSIKKNGKTIYDGSNPFDPHKETLEDVAERYGIELD